ncbi:MAG: hopanoid-associated sugar epimerase [Thermodesulfobacteriota bacterium]
MTTLVTGATGFVGSAVARALLKRGHKVRLIVRVGSGRQNIRGLDAKIFTGDLADIATLRKALKGCEALFHVAADYRLWVPDPEAMYKVNETGTSNIMEAALQAGVSRIVYTSSVATMGLNSDQTPADEDTPSVLGDMIGHYKRSKFLAEEIVARLIDREGLPAVIVNPSTPVGPRDIRPTPTGRLIVKAISGHMPAYVNTGLNIVHVDDVAEGHMLAFEKGEIGERYILGGENLTLSEILGELARISGRSAPRIRLPHGIVLPLAHLSEAWTRLVKGSDPMLTKDGARMAKKYMFFKSAKAGTMLGYSPGPAVAALSDAVKWFRENHYS